MRRARLHVEMRDDCRTMSFDAEVTDAFLTGDDAAAIRAAIIRHELLRPVRWLRRLRPAASTPELWADDDEEAE